MKVILKWNFYAYDKYQINHSKSTKVAHQYLRKIEMSQTNLVDEKIS